MYSVVPVVRDGAAQEFDATGYVELVPREFGANDLYDESGLLLFFAADPQLTSGRRYTAPGLHAGTIFLRYPPVSSDLAVGESSPGLNRLLAAARSTILRTRLATLEDGRCQP